MKSSRNFTAMLALIIPALGWALAPIFISLLKEAYDPFTQTFMRYVSATIPLVIGSLIFFRSDFLRALRHPAPYIAMGLLNIVQQCTWTYGCYGATPNVAQILTKLTVVFVIVLSFFLFHEERGVIGHPGFLIGTLFSFLGVAGILTDDPASLVPSLDRFTMLLLATALMWGVYTVWAKHLVNKVHPVPMFTVVSMTTCAGFALLSYRFGSLGTVFEQPPSLIAVAAVSGLLCIAAGHPSFHYAQRQLGSALCTSLILLNPLITIGVSKLIWPDEHFVAMQWAGGALLLGGSLLVTWAGHRVHGAKNRQALVAQLGQEAVEEEMEQPAP